MGNLRFQFVVFYVASFVMSYSLVIDGLENEHARLECNVTSVYVKEDDSLPVLCQVLNVDYKTASTVTCKIKLNETWYGNYLGGSFASTSDLMILDIPANDLKHLKCGFMINKLKATYDKPEIIIEFYNPKLQLVKLTINTTVYQDAPPPKLSLYYMNGTGFLGNNIKSGENIIANCTISNATPQATLKFLLDGKEIKNDLRPQYDEITPTTGTTSTLSATIHLDDSKKERNLACAAVHPSLTASNNKAEKLFNILYPPKNVTQDIKKYGLLIGKIVRVTDDIDANPKEVKWSVNGKPVTNENNDKKFTLKKDENNTYLEIHDLNEDDLKNIYTVEVSNVLGNKTYNVALLSELKKEEPDEPHGAITIFSIVAGILVVISIFCVVVVARIQGRWCFGDKYDPKISGESSDTESADHSLKGRFKSSILKKRKTNSSSGEGIKMQTKDGAEETVNNKDSADAVVYLEIAVPPSNNKSLNIVHGIDNKSEYAEILHKKP